MIPFRTIIDIPYPAPYITPRSRLFFMGSCFAQNIGQRTSDSLIPCLINPYGAVYNPLSLLAQLRRIKAKLPFTDDELVDNGNRFHSLMAHSDLSTDSHDALRDKINAATSTAHDMLRSCNMVCLTFGTAWIFRHKASGLVAANCHKQPASDFVHRRLSVEESADAIRQSISVIRSVNKTARIVLTVSPIRHANDGMHGNQLSKATLLMACDQQADAEYFPSYEILLDELRDYRFYADDMMHPSSLAADYIFERFAQTYFTPEARAYMTEAAKIIAAARHRPFVFDAAYIDFLRQTIAKAKNIAARYGIEAVSHPLMQIIDALKEKTRQ